MYPQKKRFQGKAIVTSERSIRTTRLLPPGENLPSHMYLHHLITSQLALATTRPHWDLDAGHSRRREHDSPKREPHQDLRRGNLEHQLRDPPNRRPRERLPDVPERSVRLPTLALGPANREHRAHAPAERPVKRHNGVLVGGEQASLDAHEGNLRRDLDDEPQQEDERHEKESEGAILSLGRQEDQPREAARDLASHSVQHDGAHRRAERLAEGWEALPERDAAGRRDDDVDPHGVQLHEGEVRRDGGQGREVERVKRRGEDGLEEGSRDDDHDEGAEAVEDGAPAAEGPDEGVDAAEGGGHGELSGRLRGRLASLLRVILGEGEGLVSRRGVVILDDGERGVERAEGVSDLGGQRLALAAE